MDNLEVFSIRHPPSYPLVNNLLKTHFNFFQWKKNEKVLDIGCGSGNVTLECLVPILPKNVTKLVGIDVSSTALSVARNQNTNPKIIFSIFDISSKTLPQDLTDKFHHVFSFYCLHWVALPQQDQAFQNIYNMLKPGGQALIACTVTAPFYTAQEALMKSEKWKDYFLNLEGLLPPYLDAKNIENKFKKMLKKLGFSVNYTGLEEKKVTFLNFKEFEIFSQYLNKFIEYVPNDLKKEYVNDYICGVKNNIKIISESSENNGNIEVEITDLVLLISKAKI